MKKTNHRVFVFLILFFVGIAFGAWGMLTPPGGVIDNSVLIFVAQIFVLAASVYGYEIHFDIKQGQFHAGKKEEKTAEIEES